MKKRLVLLALFLAMLMITASANPFLKNKNSPTPVQQRQPSQTVVSGMRYLSGQLASYIEAWKTKPSAALLCMTLAISFAYGFIHALAPGHRKFVVFTYFLSRKAKAHEPALLGLALALIHACASLVLMTIFKTVSGAVSAAVNNTSVYMEGITFLVLIVLSVYGIIEAAISLRKKSSAEKTIKITALLLSAMYPCPAAMLILVFAINLQVFSLGVFALIALSLGMSLPIIASGYAAWAGRTALFNRIRENERLLTIIAAVLQIVAFLLLLIISLNIAMPFILGAFHRMLS